MTLTAVITTIADSITATLDPEIIAKAKLDLYELAVKNGFIGTIDDFFKYITDAQSAISTDPNNDLKLGSDNKLMVATDELNTSFEYAASVTAFWSI